MLTMEEQANLRFELTNIGFTSEFAINNILTTAGELRSQGRSYADIVKFVKSCKEQDFDDKTVCGFVKMSLDYGLKAVSLTDALDEISGTIKTDAFKIEEGTSLDFISSEIYNIIKKIFKEKFKLEVSLGNGLTIGTELDVKYIKNLKINDDIREFIKETKVFDCLGKLHADLPGEFVDKLGGAPAEFLTDIVMKVIGKYLEDIESEKTLGTIISEVVSDKCSFENISKELLSGTATIMAEKLIPKLLGLGAASPGLPLVVISYCVGSIVENGHSILKDIIKNPEEASAMVNATPYIISKMVSNGADFDCYCYTYLFDDPKWLVSSSIDNIDKWQGYIKDAKLELYYTGNVYNLNNFVVKEGDFYDIFITDMGNFTESFQDLYLKLKSFGKKVSLRLSDSINDLKKFVQDYPIGIEYEVINLEKSIDDNAKLMRILNIRNELFKLQENKHFLYDNYFKESNKNCKLNDETLFLKAGMKLSELYIPPEYKYNTILEGTDANETLKGTYGRSLLYGGDGDDILIGSSMKDTLIGGNGNNKLFGGSGTDNYIFSLASWNKNDLIVDSDRAGQIIINGDFSNQISSSSKVVKGMLKNDGTISGVSGVTWEKSSGTAIKLKYGNNNSITIENFQEGCLGLYTTKLALDIIWADYLIILGGLAMLSPIGAVAGFATAFMLAETLSAPVIRRGDPLILDLDGDGVETSAMAEGTYFDLNGDGSKEKAGWVGQDDGLLVYDRNSDGVIDSGRELFGDQTRLRDGRIAQTGFEALSEFDSNSDGIIDKNDREFKKLKVWQDSNSDGISQTEEIKTLEDLGIESINLASETVNKEINGNIEVRTSKYTKENKDTGIVAEYLFANDIFDYSNTSNIEISEETKNLLNVSGSGLVLGLQEAMERDIN